MKYLLASLLFLVGCQTLQFDKGIIILAETVDFTQDGDRYVVWSGTTDTNVPAGGILKNPKDAPQAGDIIVAKMRKGDTFWTYVRRLNNNR